MKKTRAESDKGRIEVTRNVCASQPRFSGTRITVGLVFRSIKAGASDEEILEEFPNLCLADVRLARKPVAL